MGTSNTRTHCDCGTALEPVATAGGNWGDWRCPSPKCWLRYCQDCGSHLDQNDECIAYREAEDAQGSGLGSSNDMTTPKELQMSKHDQRQTYNGPNPDGFGFVDVVGDEFKGFINLFWKDQVLALLPPPIATEIRAAIASGIEGKVAAVVPAGHMLMSQELKEHVMHARSELTRQERSPWHVRQKLSQKLHDMLTEAPKLEDVPATLLVDRAAPAADCAKLLSLLSRVTSELKQLNDNARDEIDDDMADPEGETEFCDAVAELIQDAENALASHGQPVND